MRRAFSAKAALERVIVELGDGEGKPSGKKLSYFQASVDATQNRVVLDLAQLKLSLISHDSGGLTSRDVKMAARINEIAG